MRELDRIALVGAGRLGTTLATALRRAGLTVQGPLRRDEAPLPDTTLVLLCVPDDAIAAAARAVAPGPLVGHCSGATTLEPLTAAGHEALSLHPLMTVPGGTSPEALEGASAAVAGSTPRAVAAARALAAATGLRAIEVADADRAAYHAAASVASNLLVTLEDAAERLAATAGVGREHLVPLVRAAVESWAVHGRGALTGPIARGDTETVRRQRDAIAERTPQLLALFDALANATLEARGGLAAPRPPQRASTSEVAGGMDTVRTVAAVRERVAAWRSAGETVALVPTMGALHPGHAALIARARAAADRIVVWLFVNPAQFTEAADLAIYPRDEAGDAAVAAEAGADVLFVPEAGEVYPEGFATTVRVGGLGDAYEGEHRPGHFDAVATVVLKMLNMVGPDVAVFGAKDAQQVAVVQRMTTDLDLDVRIDVVPTVREPDGLAISSRNVHLDPDERARAAALHAGLAAAGAAATSGERDAGRLRAAVVRALRERGVEPEYVAVVDPRTFAPLTAVDDRALIALAARVGATRLIDNLEVPDLTAAHPRPKES